MFSQEAQLSQGNYAMIIMADQSALFSHGVINIYNAMCLATDHVKLFLSFFSLIKIVTCLMVF